MSLLVFKTGYTSELMSIVDHRWHNEIYDLCNHNRRSNIVNKMETDNYSIVDGCIDECKLMNREEMISKITRDEILRCIDEISKPLRTNNGINFDASRVQELFDGYEFTDDDKKKLGPKWFFEQNWIEKLSYTRPWNVAEFNEIKHPSYKYMHERITNYIINNTSYNKEAYDALDQFYSQFVQYKNVPIPLFIETDDEEDTSAQLIIKNLIGKQFSEEDAERDNLQIAYDYKNKKRGEETLEPLYREEDEWILLTKGKLYEELGDAKKFMEMLMGWRI